MSEMKCSVEGCNAERFYSKGHLSTCMGVENYIDAKGNRHWHDPNSHAEQFVCSNGHHFGISQRAQSILQAHLVSGLHHIGSAQFPRDVEVPR